MGCKQKPPHEYSEIDTCKFKKKIFRQTIYLLNQLLGNIVTKYNDINEHLKKTQQHKGEYISTEFSDIKVILADVKERCGKCDPKQDTSDQ